MGIPSQGFRHAATLLLTSRVRALPPIDSPEASAALSRIAEELVALARDMNAPPQAAEWLVAELDRTIAVLSARCDLSQAKQILATAGAGPRVGEARDLFLLYVPEDRLPIAAPFAIELTKRRISVAFSEYEVASEEELTTATEGGLTEHTAGALLVTPELARKGWPIDITESERFRLIRNPQHPTEVLRTVDWVRALVSGKNTILS